MNQRENVLKRKWELNLCKSESGLEKRMSQQMQESIKSVNIVPKIPAAETQSERLHTYRSTDLWRSFPRYLVQANISANVCFRVSANVSLLISANVFTETQKSSIMEMR